MYNYCAAVAICYKQHVQLLIRVYCNESESLNLLDVRDELVKYGNSMSSSLNYCLWVRSQGVTCGWESSCPISVVYVHSCSRIQALERLAWQRCQWVAE